MKNSRLAIALQYDGIGAPRVTAKGNDEIAQRIIETAKEHNIPLEEDPALAGLLYNVELGEQIPETLYLAVAELLAFVYQMRNQTNQ